MSDARLATCDVCATGERLCTMIGDAYVCEDCQAFHERAVDAATKEVNRSYALFGNLHGRAIEIPLSTLREIVALAVKTYCEFGGDTDE